MRLSGFHLGHPNRKLVLKNKDRNNNDKDEAGEKSLHNFLRFRPIIGLFEDKSRAKRCKSVVFTRC